MHFEYFHIQITFGKHIYHITYHAKLKMFFGNKNTLSVLYPTMSIIHGYPTYPIKNWLLKWAWQRFFGFINAFRILSHSNHIRKTHLSHNMPCKIKDIFRYEKYTASALSNHVNYTWLSLLPNKKWSAKVDMTENLRFYQCISNSITFKSHSENTFIT